MYLQLQVSACCWDDFNQEWFLQEPCWGIDVIFNVIIIDHCSVITQLTLKKMVRALRHLSHTADLWKTGTLFRTKLFPSFLMMSVIYPGVPDAVCFLSVSQLYREVRIMKILNHPNIGEYLLTSSLHLCDRPELLRCHICNFPGVKQVRGRTSSHCCFISPRCFYQVVHDFVFLCCDQFGFCFCSKSLSTRGVLCTEPEFSAENSPCTSWKYSLMASRRVQIM